MPKAASRKKWASGFLGRLAMSESHFPPNPVAGTVLASDLGAIAGAAAVAGFVIDGNTSTRGQLACSNPFNLGQPIGVFGRSETLGIFGFADTAQGTGVAGNSNAGMGTGVH